MKTCQELNDCTHTAIDIGSYHKLKAHSQVPHFNGLCVTKSAVKPLMLPLRSTLKPTNQTTDVISCCVPDFGPERTCLLPKLLPESTYPTALSGCVCTCSFEKEAAAFPLTLSTLCSVISGVKLEIFNTLCLLCMTAEWFTKIKSAGGI